jgi:hypothetical protein
MVVWLHMQLCNNPEERSSKRKMGSLHEEAHTVMITPQ